MTDIDTTGIRGKKPVAFVLGLNALGLGVVRSLGRSGVKVVGFSTYPWAAGMSSKYCRALVCPIQDEKPQEALDLIVDEGKKLDEKGILYPCTDRFVLLVSRHRKVLSEYFKFMIPSEEVVEGVVNKRRTYEWAEKIGVDYPETFYPRDWSELEEIRDRITYPVFVKPYYSHLLFKKFHRKGFVVKNYQELAEAYKLIFPSGVDTMVQKVVEGPDWNMVCVCTYIGREGKPMGVFVHQKLRQLPKGFGLGTLSRTIHNDELASIGLKFYKGVGYRGIGEIEFKKDDKDGKFKLIELNARPWLQNVQATRAGINFPLIQYMDLLEKDVGPIGDYRDGVRWVEMMNDIKSYMQYRETGSLSFRDWMRSWLGADCHAHFAWDDLRPGLVSSGYGVGYARLFVDLLRKSRVEGGRMRGQGSELGE